MLSFEKDSMWCWGIRNGREGMIKNKPGETSLPSALIRLASILRDIAGNQTAPKQEDIGQTQIGEKK